MFAPLINDGYKIGHIKQYPEGTAMVYSNFTPRSFFHSPIANQVLGTELDDKCVVAGIQILLKEFLIKNWNETFFNRPREDVVKEYKEFVETFQGITDFDATHIGKLHDLGYLPVRIKALPEGTLCPVKVPMLTITNTHPEFAWLVGFLEDLISNTLWKICTIATISKAYRNILEDFYRKTGVNDTSFIDFQCHDFSLRGMSGVSDSMYNGIGHLFSFMSSDSLPAIYQAKRLYNAQGFIAGGVPASEHSVMSAGGKDSEKETFSRLLDTYPTGIVSIVSDTWDFWSVLKRGGILEQLKDKIESRDGKTVIRPDTGNPVDIVAGNVDLFINYREELERIRSLMTIGSWDDDVVYVKSTGEYFSMKAENDYVPVEIEPTVEMKGAIQCLWEIFGGTTNELGFRTLSERVGLIYGDAITPERCEDILTRLAYKGFAANNMVFGVGSYTMQYLTRDSFGFAMKATAAAIDGELKELSKDPKTGDGVKKSAVGLLAVYGDQHGDLYLKENCTWEEEKEGLLRTVFNDGELVVDDTLDDIRKRLAQY